MNLKQLPFTPPVYPLAEKVLAQRPDFVWQSADHVSQNVVNISVRTKVNGVVTPQKVKGEDVDILADEKRDDQPENSVRSEIDPDKNGPKKKAGKVVCEDLKCFVKRDDTSACEEVKEKNKWHSPPKNIFNPTVEVSSFHKLR